jgi:hypothetical protein
VKALPHRSSKYFETVCCAGIGRDGKWRRQYPVPFRILNNGQKFKRWNWISYEFTTSHRDTRLESQKVVPESITVGNSLRKSERGPLLNPLIRKSFDEANDRNESLTILRPRNIELLYSLKSDEELRDERAKHAALANQMSFFDNTAKPLDPCTVHFRLRWIDPDGKTREHDCDDWETSTAYSRFSREHGHTEAIRILKDKYEDEYFTAGLVLAFSTHKLRNVTHGTKNQWLLVGIIRLDNYPQGDLLLGAE